MNRLTLVLLLVLVGLFLISELAAAVGVSVKPKTIEAMVKAGRPLTTEILVVNAGLQPAVYQVYPDNFSNQFLIQPSEFELVPGGTQLIKLQIKTAWPGNLKTDLLIVGRSLSVGGLSAATGIKVPIKISVTGLPHWTWFILISVVGLSLVIFVVKLKGRNNFEFGPKI